MGLRPAKCYRSTAQRPWTRTSRKQKKSYVKGVPDPRIRSFEMGTMPVKEADVQLDLYLTLTCFVRDNALEAGRQAANRILEAKLTPAGYYFRVRKFPHEVLREHAMLSGAGADRLSAGMRRAFGKPKGRAVRYDKRESLMTLWMKQKDVELGRDALRKASSKLPGSHTIVEKKLKSVIAKVATKTAKAAASA